MTTSLSSKNFGKLRKSSLFSYNLRSITASANIIMKIMKQQQQKQQQNTFAAGDS